MTSNAKVPSVSVPNPAAGGTRASATLRATHVGGPTIVLEYAGLCVVSDPTFDGPRSYDGPVVLTRVTGPAVPAADLLERDRDPEYLVLVSHDQHADNLDVTGRELVHDVLSAGGPVLSTPTAAGRIPGITGLAAWQSVTVVAPDGPVRVTAVPALHGPEGAESVAGPVTGFVLEAERWPTLYVSGDNASVDLVREIAARFEVDVAIVHAGAADVGRFPGRPMTMRGTEVARVAQILPGAVVVPVHADSWAHFTESVDAVREAFDAAGITDRLCVLEPGVPSDVPPGSPDR